MIFLAFFAQVAVWINHSSFIPIASPVWNGALEVHFSGWELVKLKAGDLPPHGCANKWYQGIEGNSVH